MTWKHPWLGLSLAALLVFTGCNRSGFGADEDGGVEAPTLSFLGAGGAFGGEQGIVVLWTEVKNGDGLEVYRVFRATASGDHNFADPIAELTAGSLMYLDPDPVDNPDQTFYYVVRAIHPDLEDSNLREADAKVPAPIQQPVQDFAFDGVGGAFAVQDGIVVVWNGARNGDGSEAYKVYRASEGNTHDLNTPLAVLPAGAILYLDTDPVLDPGTTFSYVVQAGYQGSEYGDTQSGAEARIPEPDEPSLRFPGASGAIYLRGEINLFWSDAYGVDPELVEYRVYRAQAAGAHDFGAPLATLQAGTVTYLDDSLPDLSEGVAYHYVVRAFYDGQEDGNLREAVVQVVNDSHQVYSCPAGMLNVDQMYCIDQDEHVTQPWRTAAETCQAEGKQLCHLTQWYTACVALGAQLNDMIDSYEWVADSYSSTASLKAGSGSCDYIGSHDRTAAYDFRCCL